MDVSQIIAAFGGTESAMTLFGVSRASLYLWEEEGLPPKRWRQLVELAERLNVPNITLDVVMQAKPSRTRTPRSASAA